MKHQVWIEGLGDMEPCDICKSAKVQLYSGNCQANLCQSCIGVHVTLELNKPHTVIGVEQRKTIPNFPICLDHKERTCEAHCKNCEVPVCIECIVSDQHEEHKFQNIIDIFKSKQENIKTELSKFEDTLFPDYQNKLSTLETQMACLKEDYDNLITLVSEQGVKWHNAIDEHVNNLKSRLDKLRDQELAELNDEKTKIQQKITEMRETMSKFRNILASNDISEHLKCACDFQPVLTTLKKSNIVLFTFSPEKVPTDEIRKWFGIPVKQIKKLEQYNNPLSKAKENFPVFNWEDYRSDNTRSRRFGQRHFTSYRPL
ncbi:E3 ubiquitin-protein ligase TRIM45-like [Saccostrea cucullata]|uniref:E3 ubiquitin-protein ligase TRIM45-like n=1 Tax=Saccostrea cuccullata TaxID=36930 RepID=UPI002ED6A183